MARTPANRYLYNLIVSILTTLGIPAAQGGVIYVDAVEGDDDTGSYSKPFETPEAARDFAAAGDTIVVRPGTYAVTTSLLADGVNWHLFPGVTITTTVGLYVFDDDAAAVVCRITGSGTIGGAGKAFRLTDDLSDIDAELEAVTCVDVITGANGAGTLRLRVNRVAASGALVTVSGGSPNIYVDAQTVVGGTGGVLGGVAPIIYVRSQLLNSGSAYTLFPSGAGRLYVDFDSCDGCYFENAGALSETYVNGRVHTIAGSHLGDSSAAGGTLSYSVKQATCSGHAFPALRCGPGVLRIGSGSRITNLGAAAGAGGVNVANTDCLIIDGGVSIVCTDAGAESLVAGGAVDVKCYGVSVASHAKSGNVTIRVSTFTVSALVV